MRQPLDSPSARGALFLLFFCLSMAGTSRERPWGDATPMYEVAENLVATGHINITTRWPAGAPPGRNGLYYDVHPILPALVHVPAVFVRNRVVSAWPAGQELMRALACHVAGAAMGALTCLFFFSSALRLGVRRGAALLAAIGLGVGTSVWVYARSPFSENVQIACYAALLAATLRTRDRPDFRSGVLLGLAGGALLNAKIVYAVSLPGAALLAAWWLRRDVRALVHVALGGAVGFAPLALLALWYNHARWGGVTASGYGVVVEVFQERVSVGLLGMFLSPGKSIFLYSPFVVLGLFGLPALWRRQRSALWIALATGGPPLVVSAALFCWSGDYAWGPRYAVFFLPALALPAAMFIDEVRNASNRIRQWLRVGIVGVALGTGVWVQVLGSALYWDHFIRIMREAAPQWLGRPVKLCPPNSPQGVPGNCDSCFEDMYPLMWLPPFQPIRGHKWLVKHVLADSTWVQAAADAPWRSYTAAPLGIAASYPRARLDFWLVDWRKVTQAGWWLMAVWATGAAASTAWIVITMGRRPRPSLAPAEETP